MTEEDWWATPFRYKASTVAQHHLDDAIDWLEERGYREWRDWNVLFLGDGYRFDFLDAEVHTMFSLRWL